MKVTKIKCKDGTKFPLDTLCARLEFEFNKAGFVAGTEIKNSQSISIGGHMRQFNIDTKKLGHNADYSQYAQKTCKAGFKRCDIPTWDQRVKFNRLINRVFNQFSLVANIKSGLFVVRTIESGSIHNWFREEYPDWISLRALEIKKLPTHRNGGK